MKHLDILSILMLLVLGTKSTIAYASDNTEIATPYSVQKIDWSKYNQKLTDIVSDANSPKKIYLYDIQQDKFVTVGGRIGAQPILAEMGMFFYIEKVKDSDKYYIHSWVDNKVTSSGSDAGTNGDFLGVKFPIADYERNYLSTMGDESKKSVIIYIDRGKNNTEDGKEGTAAPEGVQWAITSSNKNGGGYTLHSTWTDKAKEKTEREYYLSYYEGASTETPQKKYLAATTLDDDADNFYFITVEDYYQAIAAKETKYINVSGLIEDARFERNNKGIYVNKAYEDDGKTPTKEFRDEFGNYSEEGQAGNVWQFRYNREPTDTYIIPGGQDDMEDMSYITAQIGPKGAWGNEFHNDKFPHGNYILQKITGLQPGLYRVNCQGFYFDPDVDPEDNIELYNSENHSFIFASDDPDDVSIQTRLKNIGHDDWVKMKNGTYKGEGDSTEDEKNGYSSIREKYALNAGKIFADYNPYEDKNVDERDYDNSVAILVKADEGSTTGTLYIGAGKKNTSGAKGHVLVDNFQLFYMGDKQWYLDATNTEQKEFQLTGIADTDGAYAVTGINHNPSDDTDEDKPWEYPTTYNLRRGFSLGKWESLILPCDLTGDQVKQTFGGDKDIKLSVFDKITDECIYFKSVNPDVEGIKGGKFYIIQVNKEPAIKTKNDSYQFPWGNKTAKVYGPIYQIQGIIPPSFTENTVTQDYTTNQDYTVTFHGFYYDPGVAPAQAYVVSKGNLYHLASDWKNFVGTSWYITVKDNKTGEAKRINFSLEGKDEPTAITDVAIENRKETQRSNGFIYNLSGQRVAQEGKMSHLKAGIYIACGKKIFIR